MGTANILAYSMGSQDEQALYRAPEQEIDPPLTDAYLSTANLEDVATVYVFAARGSEFCVGILLQYGNGASRSLGQCRLGVDRCIAVQRPRQFHWAEDTYRCPRTAIRYDGFYVCFGDLVPVEVIEGRTMNWSLQTMTVCAVLVYQ